MTRKLFALALFALILGPGAALADDAAPAAPTTEPAAPAAGECQSADLAEDTLDPHGSALEVSTFCQATCADGSKISVTCNGTCGATDQVCSGGTQTVQGKVTCNGATTQTCPSSLCNTSNTCTATTFCPDGTVLQCSGSEPCYGGGSLCFVQCGNNPPQFCPGHEGEIICSF